MSARRKRGFKAVRGYGKGPRRVEVVAPRDGLADRAAALFDPTITTRTLINEGAVFGLLAVWCVAA